MEYLARKLEEKIRKISDQTLLAEELAPHCAYVVKELLAPLLEVVGQRGRCRGCGAEIYWIEHRNRKRAPYTVHGINHFIDCPQSAKFKR